MKSLSSSEDSNNHPFLSSPHPTFQHPPRPTSSDPRPTFITNEEKEKKIIKKPESYLRKLMIESPISFSHVHNVLNMVGINAQAMSNGNNEESFFKTMFYINTVEKVELRKHAIIIQLKCSQQAVLPLQYLINRYKSLGDANYYALAQSLQKITSKIQPSTFPKALMKSFDGEPLSRFIDSMDDQIYMCKVAPNKLVISRKLLELLGEDPENYAVELTKYKMPLREIISAESYTAIMKKTLENINSMGEYVAGQITANDLHAATSLDFNDYLYNRQHKKIHCSFVLFMPTPQMSCIQVREVLSEPTQLKERCESSLKKRKLVDEICKQFRYSEAETLNTIMKVPEGLLRKNIPKVAGYKEISCQI